MKPWNVIFITTLCCALAARAQQPQQAQPPQGQVPIYRVTVIGRSIKAINYGNRNIPTKIDFRGTVLDPKARGEATVESKRGATKVDAKFEHMQPPTRYGAEYLTYVLWAITPEGRANNLGEIVLDPSNHGTLKVTSEMQAFGLMVTAEPYYSVTQPSDVVVLENAVRSDTLGKVEEITARAELLPRGTYTLTAPPAQAQGKKVGYHEYESILALYQARNAVQLAHSQLANRYAADTMNTAVRLLQDAENYHARKMDYKLVIQTARESAQAAEDARVITMKRMEDERQADERRLAAEHAVQANADAQAAADQARQDAERAARDRAAAETARADTQALQQQPAARGSASDLRLRLAQDLVNVVDTRDTARGLVANLYDDMFDSSGANLRPFGREKLSRISGLIASHPGLQVDVEGFANGPSDEQLASQRAAAVREYLVQQGVPATSITARGFSMRPGSATVQGRHVEIIISGEPIGAVSVSRLDRTGSAQDGVR